MMKKLVVRFVLCGLACLAPVIAMAENAGAVPTTPLCRLNDSSIADQGVKAAYWMMVAPGGDVIADPGTRPRRSWELPASDDVIPDNGGKGPYWDLLSSDDVIPGDPGKQGNFWGLPGSDDVTPDGGGKGTYWGLQSGDDVIPGGGKPGGYWVMAGAGDDVIPDPSKPGYWPLLDADAW
jgi:hypothetical protein